MVAEGHLPRAAGRIKIRQIKVGLPRHTLETLQRSFPDLQLEKSAAVAHEAPENGFSFRFFY